MENRIVVADANETQCKEICNQLARRNYFVTAVHSLDSLEGHLKQSDCRIAIIDMETLPVNLLLFRGLKAAYKDVFILGISNRTFHPELREAISQHIFACTSKPVDIEELAYLIKSIGEARK